MANQTRTCSSWLVNRSRSAGNPTTASGPDYSNSAGAGYYRYPSQVSSVSVTFTAPAVSCANGNDQEWLSPGIAAWNYNTGTLNPFVGAEFNCNYGSVNFYADASCLNQYAACEGGKLTMSPGDRIEASLSEGTDQTVGTVKDLTTRQSASVTTSTVPGDDVAFVGDTGPSFYGDGVNYTPVFRKQTFTKAQVNGRYVGDWNPNVSDLATNGGVRQIKTAPLSGDGDQFTTKFLHT